MARRNLIRFLTELVFPPVCRACGERQRVFTREAPAALCSRCIGKWEEQKKETCGVCECAHIDCRCMPESMQNSGAKTLIHLAEYRPDKKNIASMLVLRCKDHNDREVFHFLAEQLAEPLQVMLEGNEDSLRSFCVTYVPRRRAAVRATGHDHAKQIAHMLAHELTIPFETMLRRKPMAKQQKSLGAAEREKNAASSFELVPKISPLNQTIVLIDDVCTTGASLATCAKLLCDAGADRVICAVVARTGKGKKAKE